MTARRKLVGPGGIEPPSLSLSGTRSHQSELRTLPRAKRDKDWSAERDSNPRPTD